MMTFRGDIRDKLSCFPWAMVGSFFFVTSVGLVTLYAAAGSQLWPWTMAQMMRCGIGFVCLFTLSFVNPRVWQKYSYVLYVACLFFLILVTFLGFVGLGAKRWINLGFMKLQPSEFMKLGLIFALAHYFHHHPHLSWRSFFPLSLLVGLPALVIMRQPDLGTGLILVLIFLTVLWVIGMRVRIFVLGIVALSVACPVLWSFLHAYQKARIHIFLDPNKDPLGRGYQLLQSKISLGSGRLWGRGFLEGVPSHLDFLPEKHTDFIFTTFGEAFGFVGSMGLLLAYSLLLWQGYQAMWTSRSTFTYVMAVGINAMLFIHVAINIAMVMGLLPIVGVPLPLLSYGGSSFVTFSIAYGILCSIRMHEKLQLPYRDVTLV